MRKALLILLISLFCLTFYAQTNLPIELSKQVSVLKNKLSQSNNDSLKIIYYTQLEDIYYDYNSDSSIYFSELCIKHINDIHPKSFYYKQTKAKNLYNIGDLYSYNGDHEKGINTLKKSLILFQKINDSIGEADCLGNIGSIYELQGNIKLALEYLNKSLKLSQKINYQESIAINLNDIAFIYSSQGHTQKSIENLILSSQISKETEDYETLNATYINIGATYYKDLKNLAKGEEYYKKALAISTQIGDQEGIVYCNNSLGMIYYELDDYSLSKKYLLKSLVINNTINNREAEIYTYNNLSLIYFSIENIDSAILYANKALNISQKFKFPKDIELTTRNLIKLYEAKNDYENAFKMQRLNILMRDSINNRNTQVTIADNYANQKYKEQKAIDDKLKQKEVLKERGLKEKQQLITYFIILILIIVISFLIFIFNKLAIVGKQKHEIKQQKIETEKAKQRVDIKNKEINDSINYAEMIQNAVLPRYNINNLFKNSFVYFNPKENISGDFYWLEKYKNMRYFSVADCTGHGIPGAFISMIGTILLNEIHNSKQLTKPNLVLDELNRLIKLTLTDKEGYTIKDGMDISFANLNIETNELLFSGANNPIWFISKDKNKIINGVQVDYNLSINNLFLFEIKGDKKPIGEYQIEKPPFTLNKIQLNKGDSIYLFSDGYVDQFGGEQNKKFKAKSLKQLLLLNAHLNMNTQKEKLHLNFEKWRGDFEQIDDVTIMGIKI